MSADGLTERAAILARLQTIPDVTIYRGIPDYAKLARNPDGTVKPYGVIKYAGPIPTQKDRLLNASEADQSQILAVMFVGYAAEGELAEKLAGAATNKLLGWVPSDTSTAMTAAGGYAFTTISPNGTPSRFEEAVSFQTFLNQ